MGQELVPCVLLSFDNEQILMWRGRDWKSMYQDAPLASMPSECGIAGDTNSSGMKGNDEPHCDCHIESHDHGKIKCCWDGVSR